MRRAALALIIALASVALHPLPPVAAAALDAAPCTYNAATRQFGGSCYFDQNPNSTVACQLNYRNYTYNQGCNIYRTAEERPSRPVTVPPGCDTSINGSFYCPDTADEGQYVPNPGFACTYDDANANYICEPLVPEGMEGCTYDPANEQLICDGPEPSPGPGGDPCTTGANLICNGDFSDTTGHTGYVGSWGPLGGSACSGQSLPGYNPHDGAARFRPNAHYAECANLNVLRQDFAIPPGAINPRVALTMQVVGGIPNENGDPDHNMGCGNVYIDGQPLANIEPIPADGVYSNGWCRVEASPLQMIATATPVALATDGREFHSFVVAGVAPCPNYGPCWQRVDNIVLTLITDGNTDPSPSPSPSPGPGGGGPASNCTWQEGNENYICTQPAPSTSDNPQWNCTYSPENENYVCQGPIPPGNPPGNTNRPDGPPAGQVPGASPCPSPSPLPSPAPSPSPSECVGSGGGYDDGGGAAGSCSYTTITGLRSLGQAIVCAIQTTINAILSSATALARGLGMLLDLARVPIAMLKQVYDAQEKFLKLQKWLVDYSLAVLDELVAAIQAPAFDAGDYTAYLGVFEIPIVRLLLTAASACVWFTFGMWLLKQGGKLT